MGDSDARRARLPEPLLTVLVGYETFAGRIGQSADGMVVTWNGARLLDKAWVEQVVFDSPDRVTNVGVCKRIFSGATPRSVEVRDRECFHPLCDIQAEKCEIDHVQPWSAGGVTTDEKGLVACAFHDRPRRRQRGRRPTALRRAWAPGGRRPRRRRPA